MEPRLPDIVRATVAARGLFSADGPVVALVSGGADSTALLRVLAESAIGRGPLSVLHVNHLLRGVDADRDEGFVVALCEALGVECRVVRFDVAAYADADGLNLEDAGRRVRYLFADEELDARCATAGVAPGQGRIASAHTLDDRLETLVARLLTGAGAGGLASIRHARGRIVRPLLDARRSDVEAYLTALGQSWCEDATNSDTSRQRAMIRAEVLPVLEAAAPGFAGSAVRTLEVLSDENDLLDGMARAFAGDFTETADGEVAFVRDRMCTLSRAMARRTVRAALVEAFPEASRIEFEHVESIVDGLALDAFARDLPFGLRAHTEYARLIVSRSGEVPEPLAPALLSVPGTVDLGVHGAIEASDADPCDIDDDPDTALVDADTIGDTLTVDGVRQGDRMRPLGMKGTKKLQDLLCDEKVARRRRSQVPVVRDGASIVWVAGVRMSEDHRVTNGTKRAVRLAFRPAGDREDDQR